jgi:hypothetical protein
MRQTLFLAMTLLAFAAQAQRTFDVTIADSTYHMRQYWPACR